MSRPGRALHDPAKAKWPAIVLQVSDALGAPTELALEAATVVEFVIGALDVVDDIIDDELEPELPGNRCLNATLALLALAEGLTLSLSQRLSPPRLAAFRASVQDALVSATQGEEQDILFEAEAMLDEQAALEMTEAKSGSLVAMAFRAAASLASEDPSTLDALAELGKYVGVSYQLQNDAEACTAAGALSTTDLRLRKKTLPVAYALQCARSEGNARFLGYFAAGPRSLSKRQVAAVQRYIAACGALHYTWTVCEAVRRQAETHLQGIAAIMGGDTAAALSSLIPTVRPMTDMG